MQADPLAVRAGTSSAPLASSASRIRSTRSGQFSGRRRARRRPRRSGPLPLRSIATCRVSFSEPGLFSGSRLRAAGPGTGCARSQRRGASRRRRGVPPDAARRRAGRRRRLRGDELLELLRRSPCRRASSGQVLLLAVGDRLGVGLAEVAAGAAVELGHRGHQPALERLALGQLQPLVDRQGRVVPGESSSASAARRRPPAVARGDRRAGARPCAAAVPFEAEPAGEEAVEPGRCSALNGADSGRSGMSSWSSGRLEGRAWASTVRTVAARATARRSSSGWRRTKSSNDSSGAAAVVQVVRGAAARRRGGIVVERHRVDTARGRSPARRRSRRRRRGDSPRPCPRRPRPSSPSRPMSPM